MGTNTDEVRRDIEQTRTELSQTLEAIGERVAPKRVVARAKDNVAERVDDVKEKISPSRLARRPADALRRGFQSVMGSGEDDDDSEGYRRAPSTGTAGRTTSARNAPRSVRERAEGNPLAAGAVAFAAGFVAASLLKPSERERQLASQARQRLEPLREEAVGVGRQVAGELQRSARDSLAQVARSAATTVAGDVIDEVTGTARELKERASGDAQEVKAQARTSARRVSSQARTATKQVKGTARSAAPTGKRAAKGAAKSPAKRAAKRPAKSTAATRSR